MTDRAKSALFSIFGTQVIDSRFLDLYAGTGQVGIEALSRGASEAVLVERSARALRTIHENVRHTGLGAAAHVVRADVFQFLAQQPEPFDFVFLAPPQYRALWKETLGLLDRDTGWLAVQAWVIAQIHPREYEELTLEQLTLFDRRSYGSVMLCFYKEAFAETSPLA